jgi:hypothetical protein
MTASELYSMIVDAPIAYDANKVVEQIKDWSFKYEVYCDMKSIVVAEIAIDIVKGGGDIDRSN